MKPTEYYRKREQTYLKHFFLEQYLETVAYHIGYSQKEFVYVDCFSGPWRAADEELSDTSIRIALERLNSVHNGLAQQQRYPKIRAIFVEKSPSAFETLQQMLERHRGDVATIAFPGTFEDNVDRIVKEVGTTFTFFFVDPTGTVAMDNLRPILNRLPGEVMINLMYDFINRFINYEDTANEASLDRCFGTGDWRMIREARDRESATVSLYMEQVRATGSLPYVTSTRILNPLRDRTYFYLIYATKSAKGLEKFRDVEKKVFTAQKGVRATAQREHREERTGQIEIDLGSDVFSGARLDEQTQQLQKAETKLFRLLQKGPLKYETLQPLILELPLVCNTDLNKILAQGRKDGRIMIDGLGPKKRVPKYGCTIRLVNPK
jgi:three-Cys-motif partner protein